MATFIASPIILNIVLENHLGDKNIIGSGKITLESLIV